MTSSQPVVTPNALNFTPDNKRCYAFSGAVAAVNSTQTLFNFTTTSEYIVATLTMTAPIRMDVVGDGKGRNYQLDYNGQTVGLYMVEAISEDMPSNTEVRILIPPFTSVVLTCYDTATSASHLGTANLTGEAYGMTETDFQ